MMDYTFSWNLFLICLLFRSFDFISTYMVTPNLKNEGNLIAKFIGWKGITALNVIVCIMFAHYLTATIVICTMSLLVTGNNFGRGLLARGLGEERAREISIEAIRNLSIPIILLFVTSYGLVYMSLGVFMLFFSDEYLIQSIALGFIAFGTVIVIHLNISMIARKRKLS
jgi:hypothetical protein